jgi:hypothetical protein
VGTVRRADAFANLGLADWPESRVNVELPRLSVDAVHAHEFTDETFALLHPGVAPDPQNSHD